MRILLSNDDGVYAPGLHAMAKALKRLGDVWIVAPAQEQSTKGHSLTLHKPLRVEHIDERIFAVTGTPADCIAVGMGEILPRKPDLVVSGINRGANLGQDIFYSGTVSAAREACMQGIPSFAVSLDFDHKKRVPDSKLHWTTASGTAMSVIRNILDQGLPPQLVVNINVPNLPRTRLKGIRVARQGFRHYGGAIIKRLDHRGREYFWVGGKYHGFRKEEGTDCMWVSRGFATVTPLRLDTTDFQFLRTLAEQWDAEN